MSELDKAVEVLKFHKENTIDNYDFKQAIDTVVSTIEQLRDKVNKDIEDGNFVRHGIKQGGKGGDTYYKMSVKEYAQEILEIIGG